MPGVDHGFLPALWAEQRERAQLRLPEQLQSGFRTAAGAEHPFPLLSHKPASLYKRYPPEEARRIIKRLEIHYTPKHGSWLDIAEIELNVMTRQCLSRRIADIDRLRSELSAWEVECNTLAAKVNWHFRTSDERIKLSSLYPSFTTAL